MIVELRQRIPQSDSLDVAGGLACAEEPVGCAVGDFGLYQGHPRLGGDWEGSSRWSRQVSAWIQKLKPTQSDSNFADRKPGALNYCNLDKGPKAPHCYFDAKVSQNKDSFSFSSSIKHDEFILVLYHRKSFLLPKFHPTSLHFIDHDSLRASPTNTSPKCRRKSDPNIFGLDYELLKNESVLFPDYQSNASTSFLQLHDCRKRLLLPEDETPSSSKGVKQKIRERLNWLLNSSKTTVSSYCRSQSQTATSSPTLSQSLIKDSTGLGTNDLSSREQSELKRIQSYPSKPTTKNEAHELLSNRSHYQYRHQPFFHKNINRKSNRDLYQQCHERLTFDEDGRQQTESEFVPYEVEVSDVSATPHVERNVADTKSEKDVENIVVSTLKSFHDNVSSFTYKLRRHYSRERSSSCDKENEDHLSLKEYEIEHGRFDNSNVVKRTHLKDQSTIDEERKGNSFEANAKLEQSQVPHLASCSLRLKPTPPKLKMSRRKSNENEDESSGEPLPKHSRSMSLPEEAHEMYQPVRPQRKKHLMKLGSESQSGEEDYSPEGPEFADGQRPSWKNGLHNSRRKFLCKMVSLSSEEEEMVSSGVEEEKGAPTETLYLKTAEDPADTDDRVTASDSGRNDKQIIDVVEASGVDNKLIICDIEVSEVDDKHIIEDSEVLPDEYSSVENETLDNEDNTTKFSSEVARFEFDVNKCEKVILETDCDTEHTVIEYIQEETLPDNSMYVSQEISTYDILINRNNTDSVKNELTETSPPMHDLVCSTRSSYEEECSDYSSQTGNVTYTTNDQKGGEEMEYFIHSAHLRQRESQPHIFVTPAEGSDDEIVGKEKTEKDSKYSFSQSIQSYRSDWTLPPSMAIIPIGKESSIDSQQESSTIFSEIEDYSPSIGDRFNVSPNLSPCPGMMSPMPDTSDHHPATPKSPITVQEWIDSLPTNIEDQRGEPFENDWRDERENPLMCSETPQQQQLSSTKEDSFSRKVISRGESLLLGDEASALTDTTRPAAEVPAVDDHESQSFQATSMPESGSPFTVNSIQHSTTNEGSESVSALPSSAEIPTKRSLFAETREKQTSFQSETSILSGVSHQTVSSIESLLEPPELDAVGILLNLGFGSFEDDDVVSKIPDRFLNPSKVPGNDIDVFLKQREEESVSDLVDSSEFAVPNISSQALRRSSVMSVSPLVTNLMETFRENQNRLHQRRGSRSDITVSTNHSASIDPKTDTGSRFFKVARGIGKQASLSRRLAANSNHRRDWKDVSGRESVLMPENRRYLDLQGQRSPEVPKRRLIIGSDAFRLGINDEILDVENGEQNKSQEAEKKSEEVEKEVAKVKEKEEEEEEELIHSQIDGGGERGMRHRDSICSIVSSVTSVDSKEEAFLDELHQLTLSVLKGRSSNPSSSSGKVILPQEKKKNLIKRLSGSFSSKRRSMACQSCCSDQWDVGHQIEEEQSQGSSSPSPPVHETSPICCEMSTELKSKINKRRSITRQENVDHLIEDNDEAQHPSVSKSATSLVTANWSMESGRSIDTVKYIPLNRSLALDSFSLDNENSSSVPRSNDSSISTTRDDVTTSSPRPKKVKLLRRTRSWPDYLSIPLQGHHTPESTTLPQKGEDIVKSTSQSLQTSLNMAMIALLQACKTQMFLQDHVAHTKGHLTTKPIFNQSLDSTVDEMAEENYSLIHDTEGSIHPKQQQQQQQQERPKEEISEAASLVRSSISNIITHLEHFMRDVCPKNPSSSPHVANIVGQMLWLSQHQSQLCSDLEELNACASNHSIQSATTPLNTRATSSHFFHRSLPDQLNTHFTHTPFGIYSPPYHAGPVPPLGSSLGGAFTFPRTATCHTTASPSPRPKGSKLQASHSESSYDGSFELGGIETGGNGNWNEGKTSGVSSPTFSRSRSVRSPDSPISESVIEKISHELEEHLNSKVSHITSNMTDLSRKMDKSADEVSDIKDKLTVILQWIRSDKSTTS